MVQQLHYAVEFQTILSKEKSMRQSNKTPLLQQIFKQLGGQQKDNTRNQKAMTCSDRNQRRKYRKWTTTRTAMSSNTRTIIHCTQDCCQNKGTQTTLDENRNIDVDADNATNMNYDSDINQDSTKNY